MKYIPSAIIGLAAILPGCADAQTLSEAEAARLILQEIRCTPRSVESYFDEPDRLGRLTEWISTDGRALMQDVTTRTNERGTTREGSYLDGNYVNGILEASSPGFRFRGQYRLESCVVIPDYVDVIAIVPDPVTQSATVEYVTHWKLSEVGRQWQARGIELPSYMFEMPDLRRGQTVLRYRPETGWSVG